MKVLNGKKSALIFQLDNGQTLKIQPGKISEPFIGTLALVRAIISSGRPGEVGLVASNAYELNMIKDIPIITQYYFSTEDEAKKAIFEGKTFETVSLDPMERKVAELEAVIKSKDEVIEQLKADAAKPSEESSELVANLRKQLADKESELNALTSRNSDLTKSNDEFSAAIADLKSNNASLQEKLEKVSAELLDANTKLRESVAAASDEKRNADGQTLDEVTELLKKLREQTAVEISKYTAEIDDLKAKLDQSESNNANSITKEAADNLKIDYEAKLATKDTEIAQLKEDGAKVVEGYNKAKAAVQQIMQQFGIAYIEGQGYVKQVAPQEQAPAQ